MEKEIQKDSKFNYSWVILGICFLMIAASLGFCSSGRNLYLTAITSALDIPRGAFSLTNTIRFITSTIVNLFFGKLISRFGSKKLICAGFLFLIGFALINAFATSLYVFYIGSIFLGIGLSWTGTTMVSSIINIWCKKNKGTITGAVLAANGLGGAIAVQIISPIIFQEGNPFGYRSSYLLVSCILAVVLFLIILFYRECPKGETVPDISSSRKKRKARGEGWSGIEYSQAVKKPYFYVSVFCVFSIGMILQGLGGIGLPHMYDIGFKPEFVAIISSIGSICLTFTKVSVGFMYDRIGMRLTTNISLFCAFYSLLGLIALQDTQVGHAIALSRCFIGSFATPLETVMLPLFAAEFFGNKDFDKFVGIFVSANYAGFAIGSPLGNLCYDLFGSYIKAFYIFGILLIIVTVAMQYVLYAAKRDRKLIEDAEKEQISQPCETIS